MRLVTAPRPFELDDVPSDLLTWCRWAAKRPMHGHIPSCREAEKAGWVANIGLSTIEVVRNFRDEYLTAKANFTHAEILAHERAALSRNGHALEVVYTAADGYFLREIGASEAEISELANTANGATTMAPTTKSLTQTLATDAGEAAWRTAGSQFVKLTREPLIGLLSRHLAPGDESARARIAAFLETEIGAAIVGAFLSVAIGAVPGPAAKHAARMSQELRIAAMAGAGDVLADLLTGPLLQVARLYLQDGVAVEPVRVAVDEAAPAASPEPEASTELAARTSRPHRLAAGSA